MAYTSPFAAIDIPEVDLFTHIFGDLTEEEGSLPALTELTTEMTVSYRGLREMAESVAGALAERGIGKGDVVALQIPNSINYVVALLGILRAGAIVSPLGVLMNSSDVNKLIKLSGASYYIGLTDIEGMDQMWSYEIPAVAAGGHTPPDVEVSADDIMAIPFSSGTTGLPKGVMLSHRNIVSNIEQVNHLLVENGVTERTNFLSPLPFSHIYGLTVLLLSQLKKRHHIFTMPKFDLQTFIDAHPKHQIGFTFIAPPMAVALAKNPTVKAENFEAAKIMLSGAAPLDFDTASTVASKLGVKIIQGYGMTETSPVTHFGIHGRSDPGSIGFAAPNTEFKIMDLETDTEVTDGEMGELLVRGPQVMMGYLNNKEATDEVLIGDGWLRTGDVARVNEEGVTYIVDRAKEVIKYKGYQVAPAELEALLLTHPDIVDSGVVGVVRDGLEIPRAFVVREEGSTLTAEELMEWVAERVTPYKKVRAVEFVDEIPKNPTGKIERKKLRAVPFEA
ncbi:Acyl-CoA synthetase (AMP-forming)/AMP-acid ligase II [Corynebacterium mycetoides]|uniref:Acyl-CoA synthetase (AMP-forming)/AMP-acid ligase II n=1 Tax=Corynebacterium mycetoides TaxID=38302 RepID=A0A1G9NQH0_9CORY|nr:AMP-binding protein [Corynebacterium mycetoides]SDL88601.1 Acyl-CoA synthetase (AMP-forming)/AMP-acid ligase II [Corynebacterium mycetoides]